MRRPLAAITGFVLVACVLVAGALAACSSSGSSSATTSSTTATPTTARATTTLVTVATTPIPGAGGATTTATTVVPVATTAPQAATTTATTAATTTIALTPTSTTLAGATTTASGPAPACDPNALLAAANDTFDLPTGAALSDPRCVGRWASGLVTAPGQDNAFAVFEVIQGRWQGANLGTDQVCSAGGVPPELYTALNCGPWEG